VFPANQALGGANDKIVEPDDRLKMHDDLVAQDRLVESFRIHLAIIGSHRTSQKPGPANPGRDDPKARSLAVAALTSMSSDV
jgi:hypothetical protein